MGASTTLTADQRKARARKAVAARHERERLIKEIADHLAGEPLSTKTTDELRAMCAPVGA